MSVGLNRLRWLCITFPPKISRLLFHFMYHLHFLLVQRHRSILSARFFLETEIEALNDKEIFPLFTTYHYSNFHWFQLHSSSVGHNCYS